MKERMKPAQMLRLLNSTARGTVAKRRELYAMRDAGGYAVGDDTAFETMRFFAWSLARMIERDSEPDEPEETEYEKKKRRAIERERRLSRSGRDVGKHSDVADPERRAAAVSDLRVFAATYFPEIFYLPFSEDHERVVSKMETIGSHGGMLALAMPRGSGKTVLCETLALWATLTGRRRYVLVVAATKDEARGSLESMKAALEGNPLLLADFPEACFYFRSLEGRANRAKGQLSEGRRTLIQWGADTITFPTIPGSASSGAVLDVVGIEGAVRGRKRKTGTGRVIRPDLVILDDPQTDESARSVIQTRERITTIKSAIGGLVGPGVSLGCVMPCTVIRRGDLAEHFLDIEENPEWQGERTKLVYSFPSRMDLWAKYKQIRSDGFRNGDCLGRAATDYYRKNRAAMDEGAKVAWPERYNPDEISAIQNAMNIRFKDEASFWSEYQNEPKLGDDEKDQLSIENIISQLNGIERFVAPIDTKTITAFVDIQHRALYYVVCAFSEGFSGAVIDYGTIPEQPNQYYLYRNLQRTLSDISAGSSKEAGWIAGFNYLVENILEKKYVREDGRMMSIARCMIDANEGSAAPVVDQFIARAGRPELLASRGRGITARSKPMAMYHDKPGDVSGLNWRIPASSGRNLTSYILADVNFWKSFTAARLQTARGDPGALTLWGTNKERHRMFAEQCTAEYHVRTEGRGRVVDVWEHRPGRDNHLWDCLVNCCVAASEQGIALSSMSMEPTDEDEPITQAMINKMKGRRRRAY